MRWLLSLWRALWARPCEFCYGTGTFPPPGTFIQGLRPHRCGHCQGTGQVQTW